MYSIHRFVDYLSNYLGVLLKNVRVDVYQNQNGKQESTFETLEVISYSTFMYNSPRIQGQMDTLRYLIRLLCCSEVYIFLLMMLAWQQRCSWKLGHYWNLCVVFASFWYLKYCFKLFAELWQISMVAVISKVLCNCVLHVCAGIGNRVNHHSYDLFCWDCRSIKLILISD